MDSPVPATIRRPRQPRAPHLNAPIAVPTIICRRLRAPNPYAPITSIRILRPSNFSGMWCRRNSRRARYVVAKPTHKLLCQIHDGQIKLLRRHINKLKHKWVVGLEGLLWDDGVRPAEMSEDQEERDWEYKDRLRVQVVKVGVGLRGHYEAMLDWEEVANERQEELVAMKDDMNGLELRLKIAEAEKEILYEHKAC